MLRPARTAVIKDRLVERLILEDNLERTFFQCTLFLVGFVLFLSLVHMATPTGLILPIHEAIAKQYDLASLSRIQTLPELQDYLARVAIKARHFSPGSSVYVDNLLARAYVADEILSVPKPKTLAIGEYPVITSEFTVTAWVQTRVQYDTVISKWFSASKQFSTLNASSSDAGGTSSPTTTFPDGGSGSPTTSAGGSSSASYDTGTSATKSRSGTLRKLDCWRLNLDRIEYGEHVARTKFVVHSPASHLYGGGGAAAHSTPRTWEQSRVKRELQDGRWHHWGVVLNATHVRFAHDGVFVDPAVALPEPITDCGPPDAKVQIGSLRKKAKIVQVGRDNLKYFWGLLAVRFRENCGLIMNNSHAFSLP